MDLYKFIRDIVKYFENGASNEFEKFEKFVESIFGIQF